jgi:hypothetical protein
MSKSLDIGDALPAVSSIEFIWLSTPDSSRFRKLLMDFFIAKCNRSYLTKALRLNSSAFVRDVALATLDKTQVVAWQPAMADNSQYLKCEEPVWPMVNTTRVHGTWIRTREVQGRGTAGYISTGSFPPTFVNGSRRHQTLYAAREFDTSGT